MFILYGLGSLFTLWMAVDAVRRGKAGTWLWIILLFGPVGAAVYFFSEYAPVTAANPFTAYAHSREELRRARADVRRLDTLAAWTHLASVLRARRSFGEAAEAAATACRKDGASVDAHFELGLALLGDRRPSEAVEPLRKAVARDPWHQSGDALLALAEAQEGAGDEAGARQSLETLSSRHGRPEILYKLATLQARTGDRSAAAASLQRILDEAEYVAPYLQRNVRPWVRKAEKALEKLAS